MPERHDVLADPLPPRIRKKLEAVVKNYPLPPTAPKIRRETLRYADRIKRYDRSKDDQIVNMWDAGIPMGAIGCALGIGGLSAVFNRMRSLRRRGLIRTVRGQGWHPPKDWKRRLDGLLEQGR